MGKIIRWLRENQKEFQNTFNKLCYSRSAWQVWSDFIECSACAISNAMDTASTDREKREERYIQIMQQYSLEERILFPELLQHVMQALETEPEQDFLGEMFMALELGSHWHGQFFTPYSLCAMMAQMQVDAARERTAENGWVGVNDPACGAGALLIAMRNALAGAGIGGDRALFVAQDIDRTAALMCYIQLSLLGCAGYVVIADSLYYPIGGGSALLPVFCPEHDVWFTPMIYADVWQERIKWNAVDAWHKGAGARKLPPPESVEEKYVQVSTPATVTASKGEGQLSLF